jgi:hypothetical protein
VNFARTICDGKCFLRTKIAAGNSGCHNRIVCYEKFWLRGRDLNPRPSGYEPDELPGCSTPHFENKFDVDFAQSKNPLDADDFCLRSPPRATSLMRGEKNF